jgi:hypothetical protein
MATKKKPSNKAQAPKTENKTAEKAKIDWSAQPEMVEIVFNGKKVQTHKLNAQLLIKAGKASLA